MSFSSRRRNYLLIPHRRDGLIEWMKSMLLHSFVLDALATTGADTFSHFEQLVEEHRECDEDVQTPRSASDGCSVNKVSKLKLLVPTVKKFWTSLPLREAFLAYDLKYGVTKRRHVCISFNEIRHILNLAQVMALCPEKDGRRKTRRAMSIVDYGDNNDKEGENGNQESDGDSDSHDDLFSGGGFKGPKLVTFDGDQTLYSDGSNFDSDKNLAHYIYLLLKNGVFVAIVTAAGYEYQTEKYELRLSGLLHYFKYMKLSPEQCSGFYLFGGECNYLCQLGSDYKLRAAKESGPGGWFTSTKHLTDAPCNWELTEVKTLLDTAYTVFSESVDDQHLRARVIRKKRSVGLIPLPNESLRREGLDETVLRVQAALQANVSVPFCAFNGGSDVWVDVGNKRVGVQVLQSYLGIEPEKTLHIGDQFLNTGNDYAARDCCPCIWITKPEETTYILKVMLRLAGVDHDVVKLSPINSTGDISNCIIEEKGSEAFDFNEAMRRQIVMDVYTGEIKTTAAQNNTD